MTPKELKAWRKKNNYSQSRLAKALGVATLSVSRWERGTRKISSFLHLALKCLEGKKGGEIKKIKGKKQYERRL